MKKFTGFLIPIFSLIALTGYIKLIHPPSPLPPLPPVNKIVVEKSKHEMKLYSDNQLLATYRIAIGRGDSNAKECENDKRTPEGRYHIAAHNPHSSHHLSLRVSYPNNQDTENAKQKNCKPGGDIMIHGLRNALGWLGPVHTWMDWTYGCIAVNNTEMDQIYAAVQDGASVEIKH